MEIERSDVHWGAVCGHDHSFRPSSYSTGASANVGSSGFASHEVEKRGSAHTDLARCHGKCTVLTLVMLGIVKNKADGIRYSCGCHGYDFSPAVASREQELEDEFVRR